MRALAALAVALSAAVPPAGAATEHRVFTVALRFVPADVVVVAGDSLVLTNLESAPHDLVSATNRPDGTPWFRSSIVTLGASSPVYGVPGLPPSVYPFVCTVHSEMTGLLTVT